jgi:hypothetical protein
MATDFMPHTLTEWVQIAFWIAAGLVAVLTYLQARKTFFQPLKLEVFKLQMALLARVHELCAGPGQGGVLTSFDLRRIGLANAYVALERYAGTQFGDQGPAAVIHLKPDRLDDYENDHAVGFNVGEPSIEIELLVTQKYRRALEELLLVNRDLLAPTRLHTAGRSTHRDHVLRQSIHDDRPREPPAASGAASHP